MKPVPDDEMTLDIAKEWFDTTPCDESAANYLREAKAYWQDEMIEDDTFGRIVDRVAEWLADE